MSGRRVVAGLLEGLRELDGTHEIVVFTRTGRQTAETHGFDVRSCRGLPTSLVTNLISLPHAAREAQVDAMVFQQFAPLHGPFRRVAFVHDAIVFEHPEYFPRHERAYFLPQRLLLPRADWLCTVSEAELARIRRLGLAPPGVSSGVVRSGIDAQFFERPDEQAIARVRSRHALPHRYVLYVGRLNRRKNIANLVDGFCASEARRTGCKLVLVGPTDRHDDALQRAMHRGGADVRQLGYVPDEDLQVLYASAAAFAYISLDEGFGLPPLEAMAAGVPVVTGPAPAIDEVCRGHAQVVDPLDPRSIADGIDAALHMSSVAREAARAHAASYTWRRAADDLVSNVEAAIAAAPR